MRLAGWIFNSWRANMIILQNNAKCTTCLEFLRITNLLRWLPFWVPKPVVNLNVSTRSICTQFYNKLCIIYNETSWYQYTVQTDIQIIGFFLTIFNFLLYIRNAYNHKSVWHCGNQHAHCEILDCLPALTSTWYSSGPGGLAATQSPDKEAFVVAGRIVTLSPPALDCSSWRIKLIVSCQIFT